MLVITNELLLTQADDSRGSITECVQRSAASVCVSVRSITNYPKVFKLDIENDLLISYKWYGFLGQKVKFAGLQSTKTLKVIEWQASVCRLPPSNAHRLAKLMLLLLILLHVLSVFLFLLYVCCGPRCLK